MEDKALELTQGLDQVVELTSEFGPLMVRGALMLLVVLLSAQFLGKWLSRLLIRMGVPERRALLPVTALHITFLLVGALVVLNAMGIPALNLVRMLFTAALVILAVFVVIKPYLPGLPFSTGDLISQGSIFGVVERITFAHTMIKSIDGTRVVSPNHRLMGEPLVNLSVHPNRRADLKVFIPYDEDLEAVRSVVSGVLQEDERVLDEPAPMVALAEMAPSYREVLVRFWSPRDGFLGSKWGVCEKIDRAISEQGIRLGVPRLEVVPGPESGAGATEPV
jgi:small conductance mechanosensitive channel